MFTRGLTPGILFWGCADPPPAAPPWEDLAAQLEQDCGACHLDGFESGGFALDGAPESLLDAPSRAGMPYVTPGEPDDSYLLHKLAGTHEEVGGFGARMPIGPPWSDTDLAAVDEWIRSLR
ncbi:MAG: c-type cytochrome [Myxococcota bacterium]